MYSLNDIKVRLINADEVSQFIERWGMTSCVCYDTDIKFAKKVGLSCLNEKHYSGSRGDFFKFEIECPRYTADQIMRHQVGTFMNCQSQRYVDMDDNFSIYVPLKVMKNEELLSIYCQYEEMCKAQYKINRQIFNELGITGEKANDFMRTMLPIGVKTKLVIGFTFEALENFMLKRLCSRADEPIRQVAKLMKEEVQKVTNVYDEFFVPNCEKLMYCPEKASCHKHPSKEEFKKIIELGKRSDK